MEWLCGREKVRGGEAKCAGPMHMYGENQDYHRCVNTEFLWLRVHPVDRERSCTPAYRAIRLSDIVLRYIVDFLYGRVRVS